MFRAAAEVHLGSNWWNPEDDKGDKLTSRAVKTSTELREPTASEFREPTASEFREPTISELRKPTASEFRKPTISEFREPTTSELRGGLPITSSASQPKMHHVAIWAAIFTKLLE